MRDGIKTKALGEVCNIIGGGTPSKSNSEFYSGNILWATVRDMNCNVLSNTEMKITRLAISKSATNVIPKNNVVIATRVGLGKVCYLGEDAAINQDLKGIIPKDNSTSEEFLFWWFKSIANQIVDAGTGATVQGVKLPFIKGLQFPLFPLEEQKQIVALLDKTFAAIDQAKANVKKNLQNAKELFQSKLNEIFTQKGKGWEEKKLLEVVELKSGGTVSKSLEQAEGEIAYLKVADMNIEGNEFEITTSTRFLDSSVVKQKSIFPVGTTIFPKRGGAIATNKKRITTIPICADLNTMGVIPTNKLEPEYLHFYFRSFDLMDIANGTTILQINNYSFDGLKISLPADRSKQRKFVEQLNGIRLKLKGLEVAYLKELTNLDELKKTILQKAFAGELT